MSTEAFDIIVIGSGPGGQKAAVQGAKAGKRVALIERERSAGGACLYQGTIPSKTLRESALTMLRMKRSADYFEFRMQDGIEVATLMQDLDKVVEAHVSFINAYLEDNNIHHFHGRARLVGANEVEIFAVDRSRKRITAEHIVIATGSRPRTPPDIPVDHENILDSDSILSMLYLPRSLVVFGGGVIGSEYASIFSLLGVKVTLIDKAPRPLMFMEAELTDCFLEHFTKYGGSYMGGCKLKSVSWDGLQVVTELESGEVLKSDKFLVCQGRNANVERLGLEDVGVEQGKYGHIVVNDEYRTNIPNIFAVGDVIGPPALASCSMEQGRRAMCHALGVDPGHPFELVPMGIYAVPELASVGLNEEQAIEKYGDCVVVGRAPYREVSRSVISGHSDGLLKLVARADGDNALLGVQAVGQGATDIIHVGEMVLLHGGSVRTFLENILNFPTMGEAYRIAALNLVNKL